LGLRGTSGTEGNLWAIYLGREALRGAVLVHSDEAHYSIPKSGRILDMVTRPVRCSADGTMLLSDLADVLRDLGGQRVVLALTCGTTFKGAHDDIAGAIALMDSIGYGRDRRFIHVDGALNAMVIPFAEDASDSIRPSFRIPIDSISTSGHKMVGTAMPCGILVASSAHVERVASAVSYLRSNDTTLMGSRNGHAVLAIWNRVMRHGVAGFTADVAACMTRTERLAEELRGMMVPVQRNPHSLTVVFPAPSESMVCRYQLACHKGSAHAIVMPNVGDPLIDRFLDDYRAWWRGVSPLGELGALQAA
jgi:histidine decarboxylase